MPEEHDAVREEYDRLAGEYDRRWRPYIDATLQAVLEAVALEGRESLLDIPCGTGELEPRLLERWPHLNIVGADLSARMLQQARAKDASGRVRWIEADATRLPLGDAAFDVVVCASSFHCFRQPQAALDEFHRVLRPQGRLMLVDWCDDYFTCKLCSLWLRWTDPAFYRTYALGDCRTLVEQAGFRVERGERFRISPLWGLMRLVCRRQDDDTWVKDSYPALDKIFGGKEGWDAPGMELYDDYDKHRPA